MADLAVRSRGCEVASQLISQTEGIKKVCQVLVPGLKIIAEVIKDVAGKVFVCLGNLIGCLDNGKNLISFFEVFSKVKDWTCGNDKGYIWKQPAVKIVNQTFFTTFILLEVVSFLSQTLRLFSLGKIASSFVFAGLTFTPFRLVKDALFLGGSITNVVDSSIELYKGDKAVRELKSDKGHTTKCGKWKSRLEAFDARIRAGEALGDKIAIKEYAKAEAKAEYHAEAANAIRKNTLIGRVKHALGMVSDLLKIALVVTAAVATIIGIIAFPPISYSLLGLGLIAGAFGLAKFIYEKAVKKANEKPELKMDHYTRKYTPVGPNDGDEPDGGKVPSGKTPGNDTSADKASNVDAKDKEEDNDDGFKGDGTTRIKEGEAPQEGKTPEELAQERIQKEEERKQKVQERLRNKFNSFFTPPAELEKAEDLEAKEDGTIFETYSKLAKEKKAEFIGTLTPDEAEAFHREFECGAKRFSLTPEQIAKAIEELKSFEVMEKSSSSSSSS